MPIRVFLGMILRVHPLYDSVHILRPRKVYGSATAGLTLFAVNQMDN